MRDRSETGAMIRLDSTGRPPHSGGGRVEAGGNDGQPTNKERTMKIKSNVKSGSSYAVGRTLQQQLKVIVTR